MTDSIHCKEAQEELQKIKASHFAFEKKFREFESLDENSDSALSLKREIREIKTHLDTQIRALEQEVNPFEAWFDIKNQYAWQVHILLESGILYEFEGTVNGKKEIGFFDIKSNFHTIPTLEEIVAQMRKKREFLRLKKDQGFGRFLLVPFGTEYSFLVEALERILKEYCVTMQDPLNPGKRIPNPEQTRVWGNFLNEKTGQFELRPVMIDTASPISMNRDLFCEDWIYRPRAFVKSMEQGQTKRQILEERHKNGQSAWDILLLPEDKNIPPRGTAKKIGGRWEIDVKRSVDSYFHMCFKPDTINTEYHGEEALTPEAWVMYALSELIQYHELLDCDQVGSVNMGAFNPDMGDDYYENGLVPYAAYDAESNQIVMGEVEPNQTGSSLGVHPVIRI